MDQPDTDGAVAAPFQRALWTVLGVLAVLCLVFVGLTSFQGPKLSSAEVDTTRVTAEPDQQLRLFANQQLAEVDASQVTVSPAAEFTVRTENDVIAVQFSTALDFSTDYSVSIEGVTSLYQDRESTFEFGFVTDDASIFYLDRADPEQGARTDSIMTIGLNGGGRDAVYSATRIQDFVVLGKALVVVTLNEDNTSAITLVSLLEPDGPTEKLLLPDVGTVDDLQVAGDTGVIGFTMTSALADPVPKFAGTLFSVDLTAAHTIEPVLGIDGEPLDVLDWFFLPGGTEAVVQRIDESVFRLDLAGELPPTPLGSYTALQGVSLDGSQLAVADVYGPVAVSLADGSEARLDPAPIDGVQPFAGATVVLDGDLTRVQKVALFDEASGRFSSLLMIQEGDVSGVLYTTPGAKGSIDEFSVSPNGQYVAVTTTPDVSTSDSDRYRVDPQSTSVTTVIVDVASGSVVSSVEGFGVAW